MKTSFRILLVASGMWTPNIPPSMAEYSEGYEDVSINPEDYEGKSVLILGRGNSAFEFAQSIYGSTNYIHTYSRSRLRNAYSTHYVGDVRAVNHELLDTYQLKSLDGFLEGDVKELIILKHNEKLYVKTRDDRYGTNMTYILSILNEKPEVARIYDKVIRCLGFKFNKSIFAEQYFHYFSSLRSMKFSEAEGRISKYPVITHDYQSKDFSNLYFIGTISHSLDFRKSSGGFIHGFRYTIRSLHRILEYREHKIAWPSIELPFKEITNYTIKRINEAAGPYQMFGLLVDIISINRDSKTFTYFEEIPLGLLTKFSSRTGKNISEFFIVNLEYGKNFSGPDKDVFRQNRAVYLLQDAHLSNFLHPVFYYYESSRMLNSTVNDILEYATKVHHVIEEFTTFWTHPTRHVQPLQTFFNSILFADIYKDLLSKGATIG